MSNRLPFHAYSSYNKRGGKTHPVVSRRLNQVLDMWAAMMTREDIAEHLDISVDAVKQYLRRGRRRGDPRAKRPIGMNRIAMRAKMRRHQIKLLHEVGYTPKEIATRLECTERLVMLRMKETTRWPAQC